MYEILGRPPEHIKQALENFVENLGKQEGIEIINKKVHEPHTLEKKDEKGNVIETVKDLFTSFAEVELLIDNGANPNIAFCDDELCMPLDVAAERGNIKALSGIS